MATLAEHIIKLCVVMSLFIGQGMKYCVLEYRYSRAFVVLDRMIVETVLMV